jgi:hypothetical protein
MERVRRSVHRAKPSSRRSGRRCGRGRCRRYSAEIERLCKLRRNLDLRNIWMRILLFGPWKTNGVSERRTHVHPYMTYARAQSRTHANAQIVVVKFGMSMVVIGCWCVKCHVTVRRVSHRRHGSWKARDRGRRFSLTIGRDGVPFQSGCDRKQMRVERRRLWETHVVLERLKRCRWVDHSLREIGRR